MANEINLPPETKAVLDFWFVETGPERWFAKSDDFDEEIRVRFGEIFNRARVGELDEWAGIPEGALALVIILDQFPRNMFRGDPRSFATDAAAGALTKLALERGFDKEMSQREKQFLYMPLQHSEDAADQALSVKVNGTIGNEEVLKYAIAHKDIIDRFGRFPHRNEILGRETTDEEAAFLTQPGSSF